MRNIFKTGAIALLGAWITIISGCGGNSTPVGITVTPRLILRFFWGNPCSLPPLLAVRLPRALPGRFACRLRQPIFSLPCAVLPPQGRPSCRRDTARSPPERIILRVVLYTAPATLPPTNGFLVVATSTILSTAFASTVVTISSGIGVTVTPTSASLAVGEHQQFLASVNGGTASGSNVTWEVNGVAGGSTADGFICPTSSLSVPANCTAGEYFAPAVAPSGAVTITAVSAADPSKQGQATVTVSGAADPTLTSLSPNTVGEGSVQQDVFLSGTNFLTTSTVLAGNPLTPVPTVLISGDLLRATIPANLLAGPGPAPVADCGADSGREHLQYVARTARFNDCPYPTDSSGHPSQHRYAVRGQRQP